MLRRHFLQTAAAAALPAQVRERPNVIFILADDLGWGDLGCYGNRQIATPNLDRLARDGALFTQFYVNGSVCSPSRTAFMTSHFPAHHRIHGHLAAPEMNARRGMPNFLDPKVLSVTRHLKGAGYATGHVGKWHLGNGPGAPSPEAYGIHFHKTIVSAGASFEQQGPYFWARCTPMLVDESIGFIERNRSRPFYLNLWTTLPHAILAPTDEQMQPYARFAQKDFPHRTAMQIYYSSVTHLDAELGRLFRKVDELGLRDKTMVVFSSDNGPEDIHITNAGHSGVGSPGPFRGRKRSIYEGGVRVPFIVRMPGLTPAGRVDRDSVVTAVDFFPTVAKLAGAPMPESAGPQGEDISGILAGKSRQRTKPLLWEWRFNVAGYHVNKSPILAMREGKWKLLMNPDRSRVELYDIPADPMELNNVAAAHADTVRSMSAKMLAWQKTLPAGPMDASAGKNDYPWPGQ